MIALAGSVALLFSGWLTWGSWELAGDSVSRSLLELPVVPWMLVASVAVIAGSAVVGLVRDPRVVELGGHVAMGVALFAGFFLVAAETLTAVVPKLHLPGTAHRLAVGTAAGPGPWVALAAGLGVAVTAIGSLREWARAVLADLTATGLSPLGAVIVFVAMVPLLILLGQEIWAVGEVSGGEIGFGGDTLGWASLPLLVSPLILLLAAGCICCGRHELGALLGALGGWTANLSAAIAICFTGALVRVSVTDAHVTTAVWLTFALGFVPAAASAAVLSAGGERR